MNVTVKMNDNPKLLKIFKEIAKGFNEPIKIKKQKVRCPEYPADHYYNSDEFYKALKEVENGDVIKCKNFDEYKKAMDSENV